MFSRTKWIKSVVQLLAIILVVAGVTMLLEPGWFSSGRLGKHASESSIRSPDPETTSSILKMSDPAK